MLRRPPISTRTDTLFPYTTLFRSIVSRSPPVSTGAQTYCNLTYPTKWSRLVPVDMAFAVASCWPIALCISGGLDPFERAEEICLSRYFRIDIPVAGRGRLGLHCVWRWPMAGTSSLETELLRVFKLALAEQRRDRKSTRLNSSP